MLSVVLWLAALPSPAQIIDSNVVINEWMASNTRTVRNPNTGQYEPWVELYNRGASPVNIGGYYLSSHLTNQTQYRIADGTTLAAQGWAGFWANGLPGSGGSGGFRLRKEGGVIGLYAPALHRVDVVVYGAPPGA